MEKCISRLIIQENVDLLVYLTYLQVTVAVSVEKQAVIAIGRSYLEGCGFDFHCRPGNFLRFNSGPVMYVVVGSLAPSGILGPSTWVQFPLEPFNLIA